MATPNDLGHILPSAPRQDVENFERPSPDLGAGMAGMAALVDGFQTSFTGQAWRSAKYYHLRNAHTSAEGRVRLKDPKEFAKMFLTQEEWNRDYKWSGLEFEKNYEQDGVAYMSRPFAEELVSDRVDDRINSSEAATGSHPITTTAAGLVGGFASPVDLAVGIFTPEIKFVKWGLGATAASRSGIGFARFASRSANGAINGFANGALSQPAMMTMAEYNQTPYTLEDAMRNVALSPFIGATAGSIHAGYTHLTGDVDRHFANAVMRSVAEGRPLAEAEAAFSSSPKVREAAAARQSISDRFKQILGLAKRTATDNRDLLFMAGDPVDPDLLAAGFKNAEEVRALIRPALEEAVKQKRIDAAKQVEIEAQLKQFDLGKMAELQKELAQITGREDIATKINDLLMARAKLAQEGAVPRPKSSTPGRPDQPFVARRPRAIIADALDNPDSANRHQIRAPKSDDEKFMADAWKKLFGQDLQFVEGGFADAMGVTGFVRSNDPSRAYIRAGALLDKANPERSMMFIAGHELGHSIRYRMPKMWSHMVDSIMETAGVDDGALAEAWRTNAKYNNESGVWAGLGRSDKMDETFASVLGHAATSGHFWQSLSTKDRASAVRLAGMFKTTRDRLSRLLRLDPKSAPAAALHSYLGKVVTTADSQGRRLSELSSVDPTSAAITASAYAKHQRPFWDMAARLSEGLNEEARKRLETLARIDELHESMFPVVHSLEDNSATPGSPGRYATVLKGRRIDSGNPGLWLMRSVLAKADPGTKEYDTYAKWAQDVYSWVSDTTTLDRKDPKVLNKALADWGVMAHFKKNTDGTWDIGILRNEEFPKWSEKFINDPSALDATTNAWVSELLFGVERAEWTDGKRVVRVVEKGLIHHFSDFIEAMQNGENAQKALGRPGDSVDEFRSFLHTLDENELQDMVDSDPDSLWVAFVEHLEEKMGQARLDEDPDGYKNLSELARAVDPLARAAKDPGKNPDHFASGKKAEELKNAWKEFQKTYKDVKAELGQRDNVPASRHLPPINVEPKEYFKELHQQVVDEIITEIKAYTRDFETIRPAEKMGTATELLAKRLLKDKAIPKELMPVIERMAHTRIIDSGEYPHYQQAMGLQDLVRYERADGITFEGVSGSSKKPLDDLFSDLDQFNEEGFDLGTIYDQAGYDFMAGRLSVEEANRLSVDRLEKDHAVLKVWAHSPETVAEAEVARMAEALGAPGFTLEPAFRSESADAKVEITNMDLAADLVEIRKAHLEKVKRVNDLAAGKPIREDKLSDSVFSTFDYHLRQGLSPEDAVQRSIQDFVRDAQSRAIQRMHTEARTKVLLAKGRESLDALYSYLDGSPRRGVRKAGQSVDSAMRARVEEDTAPFVVTLDQLGLTDLFMSNSEVMMRMLLDVANGRKVQGPDAPKIQRLFEVLSKTKEVQVARLNKRGANIRMLDGHLWSQAHNPSAIRANKAEFIAKLDGWLDWGQVYRAFGPNDGRNFNRNLYLEQLWHELSKENRGLPLDFDPATMGGNIANQVSHRRTLYFKDTFAYDYDMMFGSGNSAGLIMEQLMKRSELSTVMDHFGSDYKKAWNETMAQLGRAGEWRMSKIGRIDMTFQHLVGDLNHPEDVSLAAKGRALRNYMNSVALWMSGISSLTDYGNMASTAQWMGMDAKTAHATLAAGIKQAMGKGGAHKNYALGLGAGLQAVVNGFSENTTMRGPLYRFASAASNFTFKWNGQEFTTRVFQSAFHDLLTQHLGQMPGQNMTPEFMNWLSHYGITAEEWKVASGYAKDIDGLAGTRLAADLLPVGPLRDKLKIAITDSVNQAILQPSVSDKALLTLGTKAGTISGEAVRTVMQYKGYPLAMVRKVNRRFANAYGDQGMSWTSLNRGTMDKLAWATMMIGAAGIVLSVKDLARGREPLNPFDSEQWNLRNALRLMIQAGVGPTAFVEQFVSFHQAPGPAVGSVGALLAGYGSGEGYKAINATTGVLPGASLAPAREMAKATLGWMFPETYGAKFQAFLGRNAAETGQSSVFQVDRDDGQQ